MPKPNPTVPAYIAALSPQHRKTVSALRNLIRAAAPHLDETIKWGNPCYVGRSNVCSIIAHANHVNLAFFHGATLPDPANLLQGTGKAMRHVPIPTLADLPAAPLTALIQQAATRA